ncbi:MAG: hypothetical protein IBJ18_04510 [Phycisphaerales bacterium]|nr:hypothetical protein [Phycisphaerales bacterium]
MNTSISQPDDASPVSRRELLISRVIDARATSAEYAELSEIARLDPTVWNELAQTQAIEAQMRSAGLNALDRAMASHQVLGAGEQKDVIGSIGGSNDGSIGSGPGMGSGGRTRWAGLGWGIAAVLALGMTAQMLGIRRGDGLSGTAGLGPTAATFTTPEAGLDAYLTLGKASGKVVGEMPQRYVIQSEPSQLPDGGLEVLYLRQFIERAVVKDTYRLGTDELGRTILVPTATPTAPKPEGAPL